MVRKVLVGTAIGLLLGGCGAMPQILGQAPTAKVQAKAAGFSTARDGLWRADSDARKWDVSAQLARIEGSAIENGYMMGDWGYTFYSPFKKDVALLVVFDGFSTKSFQIRKDAFARPLLSGHFNIDSRQAVDISVKNGLKSGRIFRIALDEGTTLRLQWTVQAQEGEFAVDALSGQLIGRP